MTKKDDVVKKNVVLNAIFYNKMKQVKDKFIVEHPVKRMKQFDNNYWKLIYILQFKLFDEKSKHILVEAYSKYGAEMKLNNLHAVCGFRKLIFLQLMKFFDEQDVVKAIRNKNNHKSYSSGSDNYCSRATVYYIPLQLVMQMQKCDTNNGCAGECIEVKTSKKNVFFNSVEKEIDEKVNIYGDDKKQISDWQLIDRMRIENISYDEQMFLQIARENNITDPEGELKRCKDSGKIGGVKISHGRVFRYGWNRLKKCLRAAVLYQGEHVDVAFDFHCADFKMMAVIAWMKRKQYKLNKEQLERFTEDVRGDFYQLFIDWFKEHYSVVLDRDVAKDLLLTFRNSTNDSKMNSELFVQIRQFFKEKYSTIMQNMLFKYKEVESEDGIKNRISVDCQNVEGYIVHELILPKLEGVVSEPFSMCDAIWIKKSDIDKRDEVERLALEQYDLFIEDLKMKGNQNERQN